MTEAEFIGDMDALHRNLIFLRRSLEKVDWMNLQRRDFDEQRAAADTMELVKTSLIEMATEVATLRRRLEAGA